MVKKLLLDIIKTLFENKKSDSIDFISYPTKPKKNYETN